MPVIEVSVWDLERLLDHRLDINNLESCLPDLKCELEGIEGDIISYEATHDRPDLYSAEGLARALRGLMELELGLPKFKVKEKTTRGIVKGPKYRPYAFFATVHGLNLDDESIKQLMQLQEKLHATYGRNRRRVSIGVYDLSKINPPVSYIAVEPDRFSFVPLDMNEELSLKEILKKHPKGIEYGYLISKYDVYPLLIDSKGTILSLPPIVNSEDTRVTEDTKEVFIDVTSTDPKAAIQVLNIVVTSIYERGSEIGLVDLEINGQKQTVPNLSPESIDFDPSYVESYGGIKLKVEEVKYLLEKMRLGVKVRNAKLLEVNIPPYRVDILHQVDLVEEVLMAYGYNKLEPLYIPPQHSGKEDGIEIFSRIVRELMVGLGFQEVNDYILTSREVLYEAMDHPELPTVEVENPKQEAYSCMRTWITPQLMQTLSRSKHADYPQRIFEVGDVELPDETKENKVREERRLAIALAGAKITFTDIHAVISSLMRQLGMKYELRKGNHPSLIKGRCANICVNGIELGFLGEVHPKVLERWELKVPVSIAEINLSKLRDILMKLT